MTGEKECPSNRRTFPSQCPDATPAERKEGSCVVRLTSSVCVPGLPCPVCVCGQKDVRKCIDKPQFDKRARSSLYPALCGSRRDRAACTKEGQRAGPSRILSPPPLFLLPSCVYAMPPTQAITAQPLPHTQTQAQNKAHFTLHAPPHCRERCRRRLVFIPASPASSRRASPLPRPSPFPHTAANLLRHQLRRAWLPTRTSWTSWAWEATRRMSKGRRRQWQPLRLPRKRRQKHQQRPQRLLKEEQMEQQQRPPLQVCPLLLSFLSFLPALPPFLSPFIQPSQPPIPIHLPSGTRAWHDECPHRHVGPGFIVGRGGR